MDLITFIVKCTPLSQTQKFMYKIYSNTLQLIQITCDIFYSVGEFSFHSMIPNYLNYFSRDQKINLVLQEKLNINFFLMF